MAQSPVFLTNHCTATSVALWVGELPSNRLCEFLNFTDCCSAAETKRFGLLKENILHFSISSGFNWTANGRKKRKTLKCSDKREIWFLYQ